MSSVIPTSKSENGDLAWHRIDDRGEQRHSSRINLDLPVAFRSANGQHCAARLWNISPEGIRVRCNVATGQILHPSCGRICPSNAPIVQTVIEIPLVGDSATLSVCARLSYVTTVPEEPRCIIGLQFVAPRPTALRIIERYFSEKQLPIVSDSSPPPASSPPE